MGIHHGVTDAAQAGLDKIKPDEHDHTPPQNDNPEQAAPGPSDTQDQTDTSESETDGDKKKGGFPWGTCFIVLLVIAAIGFLVWFFLLRGPKSGAEDEEDQELVEDC